MSGQVIPAGAIQAAHAAICEQNIDDCLDPDWRGKCVKAVEAAAPYMAEATLNEAAAPHMLKELRELVEQMEAQPWTEVGAIPGVAALIRSSTSGIL